MTSDLAQSPARHARVQTFGVAEKPESHFIYVCNNKKTMVNTTAVLRADYCFLAKRIKTKYGHHKCHYTAQELKPDSSGSRVRGSRA